MCKEIAMEMVYIYMIVNERYNNDSLDFYRLNNSLISSQSLVTSFTYNSSLTLESNVFDGNYNF